MQRLEINLTRSQKDNITALAAIAIDYCEKLQNQFNNINIEQPLESFELLIEEGFKQLQRYFDAMNKFLQQDLQQNLESQLLNDLEFRYWPDQRTVELKSSHISVTDTDYLKKLLHAIWWLKNCYCNLKLILKYKRYSSHSLHNCDDLQKESKIYCIESYNDCEKLLLSLQPEYVIEFRCLYDLHEIVNNIDSSDLWLLNKKIFFTLIFNNLMQHPEANLELQLSYFNNYCYDKLLPAQLKTSVFTVALPDKQLPDELQSPLSHDDSSNFKDLFKCLCDKFADQINAYLRSGLHAENRLKSIICLKSQLLQLLSPQFDARAKVIGFIALIKAHAAYTRCDHQQQGTLAWLGVTRFTPTQLEEKLTNTLDVINADNYFFARQKKIIKLLPNIPAANIDIAAIIQATLSKELTPPKQLQPI